MEELSRRRCEEILDEGMVAHVGVISRGEPYVTPLSYVFRDGTVYFRSGPGRRAEAIEQSPWVCVEVSAAEGGSDPSVSVLLWGTARFVEDGREGADVVAQLLAKYRTEAPERFSAPQPFPEMEVLVAVPAERITGRSWGHGLDRKMRPGRL